MLDRYLSAKGAVLQRGFAHEVDWQERLHFAGVTEADFLREVAWVVLSSGMRESVVRGVFAQVSTAFREWECASAIVAHRRACVQAACSVFNHPGKVEAIAQVADVVGLCGFAEVKRRIEQEGLGFLKTFAYVGAITSLHLAKNLGLDVVKPDRHLVRIAQACGYSSPAQLCAEIAGLSGERLSVVDLVLWRFATLEPQYRQFFRQQQNPRYA